MKLPLLAALFALAPFAGAASEPITLWPKGAPGETGNLPAEADMTKPTDAAVLVCPGGDYHILAMDLEGTEVCEWLNANGITAVRGGRCVCDRRALPAAEIPPRRVPAGAFRLLDLHRGESARAGSFPRCGSVASMGALKFVCIPYSPRGACSTFCGVAPEGK